LQIQDAVLSVHLHPPAAELDAAAAARAEVARADLEAKLVTAPRTHGKGHRAHKSKDAGAKDKLRQMRLEHDAEKSAEHKHVIDDVTEKDEEAEDESDEREVP
jgi:predicted acyl esterase